MYTQQGPVMAAHHYVRSCSLRRPGAAPVVLQDVPAVELHLQLRLKHHMRQNVTTECFLYPPPGFPIKLTQALLALETLVAKVSKGLQSFFLVRAPPQQPP